VLKKIYPPDRVSSILERTVIVTLLCTYSAGIQAQTPITHYAQSAPQSLIYQPQYVIGQPLRAVELIGNTKISTEALNHVIQEFLGRAVSASDVEEMRTRLTKVYVDQGYLNSGALFVLPISPATSERLQFQIIEGRIQDVRIQGLQDLDESYIKQRLPIANEVLNMHTLREQFQLLLQEPLFERIQSRLLPTGTLGEAILELDVVRKPSYSYSVFVNNYRSPAIGEIVLGASAIVRNVSGKGDALDVQVGKSRGATPYHLAWTMPLNDPLRSVQMSFDQGRSSVVEAPLDLVDIHSQTRAWELKWSQALMHTLERRFEMGIALSQRQTQSSLLGEDFSFSPGEVNGRSKTQVLKFSQDWSERGESTGLLLRSVFHFGRNNRQENDALFPVTSENVGVPPRQYWVWNGQIQWLKQLSDWNAQFLFRGQWQWSPMHLISMEKMAIGGTATVRGFREGSLLRDQAQIMSLEFHKSLFNDTAKAQQLSGFVFVDGGLGKNHRETAQTLSSYGIGLKAQYASWFADLSFAKRISVPAQLSRQEKTTWQDKGVQLQFGLKFN
jgi:hemolysin activation/secretion protein